MQMRVLGLTGWTTISEKTPGVISSRKKETEQERRQHKSGKRKLKLAIGQIKLGFTSEIEIDKKKWVFQVA